MDLLSLHLMSGLISAALEMMATVTVLFCVFSLFSFKPGGSVRFFFLSLAYFFSSGSASFIGAVLLKQQTGSVYLLLGTSALLMSALINFVYAVVIIALYTRTAL